MEIWRGPKNLLEPIFILFLCIGKLNAIYVYKYPPIALIPKKMATFLLVCNS